MILERNNKGFSLVEVMIVVVIIGILTAIALPSYQNYIRKSRRSEGIATVLNLQLAEEKYRANNVTYGDINEVWGGVTTTQNGYYTLALTNVTATSYTITATPTGDQANDTNRGVACSTLTLTINGIAETKTPTQCWN